MAIKIYEKFAPRANPADGDYPYGSIKNESVPGAKDGTPLDAVWANDYAGTDAELFAQAGIVPNGQPDKLGASQRVDALHAMFDAVDTVAGISSGKYTVGRSVVVSDRAFAIAEVVTGETVDGIGIIAAGAGKQAVINYNGNPECFGLKSGGDPIFNRKALQYCFDNTGLTSVNFQVGDYNFTTETPADEYVLELRKNKIITGMGRATTLRADGAAPNASLLRVRITDNGGFADVRKWALRDLSMFHNGGGKHGLEISGGLSISKSEISGVSASRGVTEGAMDLYVYDQLSHSVVDNCEFSNSYLRVFDANTFSKILSSGIGIGITIECELGVRNNVIRDSTLVNRDGSVHIVDGDNIRIINNQLELAQGFIPSENQSTPSTMVYVQGATRKATNILILENNFGGGTSVEHAVYAENTDRMVLAENNFIATFNEDVWLAPSANNTIIKNDNMVVGTISNPRPNTLNRLSVKDLGQNNMGVFQPAAALNFQNGWGTVADAAFYKDENGVVHFPNHLNAGSNAALSIICTLPDWAKPVSSQPLRIGVSTSAGQGEVLIDNVTGVMTVVFLPNNSSLQIPSFQSRLYYV